MHGLSLWRVCMSVAMTPSGLDGPNDNCPCAATPRSCSHALYMSSELCLWLLYQMHQEEHAGRILGTKYMHFNYHSSHPLLTLQIILPAPPHPSHVVWSSHPLPTLRK